MKTLKVKSILFSLLAVMAVAVFLTSCSKDNSVISEENEIESTDMIIQSDLMSFGSIDKFYEHYQEMDALYDLNSQKYRTVIESQVLNSVYKKLGSDVFEDPEKRYQPWLGDPVMMGIVNEYLEFQIGEVLLTYVNDDYILASKSDNISARHQIRNLGKNNEFDINAIPADTYLVPSDELETLLGPWGDVDYEPHVVAERSQVGCVQTGDTGWQWKQNGTEAISYRTRAYTTWSSLKEETKIYSYKHSGSGWSNEKTYYLYARIDATRRNENTCTWNNDEREVNTCDNCKDENARVNTSKKRRHNTSDVFGSISKSYKQNGAQGNIFASHYVPF